MRLVRGMIMTAGVAALAACGGSKPRETVPASSLPPTGVEAPAASAPAAGGHAMHGHGAGEACPMEVPGTTVSAQDVEGGVALAFTTSSPQVDEVRRRVQHMAAMTEGEGIDDTQGKTPAETGEHEGMHEGMHEGAKEETAPLAEVVDSATAENIENGARLTLRTDDPAELAQLRQRAREHAQMMARGECPDLGGASTETGIEPMDTRPTDTDRPGTEPSGTQPDEPLPPTIPKKPPTDTVPPGPSDPGPTG